MSTTKTQILLGLAALTAVAIPLAGVATAGTPANPGCFGTDRAAYATVNGSLGNDPGGVGYYASLRAGDNGTINQNYKTGCGGDPTP
jgi:hypothetical protein